MKTLNSLPERVAGTLSRYNMLPPAGRVGVAVSGGADSVCLLHVLHSLGVDVIAVHLNHQLRGAESDADARFVSDFAASLKVPCISESVQLERGNLEQAARHARLAFFHRLIAQGEAARMATAHTQSDQAETVLYRLIRGSGTAGLSGIRPVTSTGLIRPLLDVDRPAVLAYLAEHSLPWRVDSTNADPRFARNRIRAGLIPLLAREHNAAIVQALARTAEIAQDEEAWWDGEIVRIASLLPGFPELSLPAIIDLPPAIRRRLIRHAMSTVRGDLRQIDAGHVAAVLRLLESASGTGSVSLPGTLTAVRSFDRLRFCHTNPTAGSFEVAIDPPAVVPLPQGARSLSFQIIDIPTTSGSGPLRSVYNENGEVLDADRLPGPWIARNWRPGDMLHRPGHSDRKLKTLFQRARIPIWERAGWPVLTCGADVAWTRRFGVAANFRPAAETRRLLVVSEVENGLG